MTRVQLIKSYTASQIKRILTMHPDGAARAALANLRHGVGHVPGEIPEIWGEFLLNIPEEFLGKDGEPSRAEWAIYTALTLFALHQQGKDRAAESMNREGVSLGSAAARLIENEDDRERVSRRFYPVATATDMIDLSQHLRGLVTLFRANSIALDYSILAADLYLFQNPDTADHVRLHWGEDFCRTNSNQEKQNEKGE